MRYHGGHPPGVVDSVGVSWEVARKGAPQPGISFASTGLLKQQLPVLCCALSKVQVDQTLIRNPALCRQAFEVFDRVFVQPDRELFFRLSHEGIPYGIGKVVGLFHSKNSVYCARSEGSALRAEMILIASSTAR